MHSSCPALRSCSLSAAVALVALAGLPACDGDPPITMPAGFESARPGTAFKDLRATRPRARLVRKGGDVYLAEQSAPPRFRDAQIWMHFQEQGDAPAEDLLKVERVVLSTLDEQSLKIGAHEAGKASDEALQGMQKTVGDRFAQMRKATETSFGKATDCAVGRLDCEWDFNGYQLRLHTVDALGPAKQRVPIGVRYVIRTRTAPDSPQPEPVFEEAQAAAPPGPPVPVAPVAAPPAPAAAAGGAPGEARAAPGGGGARAD